MNRDRSRSLPREIAHLRATDLELLRRARKGDETAFHELVDRYGAPLFGLAFSLVSNAADAEDVVQETFLGAFRRMGSFKERSSVKTWLIRILVRQAARRRRYREGRKTVSIDELSEVSLPVPGQAESGSSANSLDARMDVLAMLGILSREHREVIVLRELQGMSYQEMAEILGVPRGTVESRLFRARQELKERFRGYLP